jgi:hypothetical protein
VDLDDADPLRVLALAALVALGFAAIWFTRVGDELGLSPLAAGVTGLVVGAIVWTGILWVVVSRGR